MPSGGRGTCSVSATRASGRRGLRGPPRPCGGWDLQVHVGAQSPLFKHDASKGSLSWGVCSSWKTKPNPNELGTSQVSGPGGPSCGLCRVAAHNLQETDALAQCSQHNMLTIRLDPWVQVVKAEAGGLSSLQGSQGCCSRGDI